MGSFFQIFGAAGELLVRGQCPDGAPDTCLDVLTTFQARRLDDIPNIPTSCDYCVILRNPSDVPLALNRPFFTTLVKVDYS